MEWLRVREDGVYVDCTAGAGGHSALIAERLSEGRLIALDRDASAVAMARERLAPFGCAEVFHRNYSELGTVLTELGIERVDGVLLDAGLSSMQIDTASRGFSFQEEGPLDMRMDTSRGPTAKDLLSSVDQEALVDILRRYGDVKPAKRIAAAILERRKRGALETTADLAEAVAEALPFVKKAPGETRQVFQAVRMAVNEELRWLEEGVSAAIDVLAPEGRLVVIAFHSGEDRIVKNLLRDAARPKRELAPDGRTVAVEAPRLRLLTRKPVVPDEDEVYENPRAHSAKLRAAERLA